jgi:uncharacterized membrane protein
VRHSANGKGSAAAANAATHRNIIAVRNIEEAGRRKRTLGELAGDSVVHLASNVAFVAGHVVWFAAWILINSGWFPGIDPFDPYPYQFLTFVVSLEAIFLALFILMSQNRAEREAQRRESLDLQINLLAEAEATKTLQMLRELCEYFELPIAGDPEVKQLARRTTLKKLASDLEALQPKS